MNKCYFMRFPEGKAKAVKLSYDDCLRTDIKLVETINKYGLKCTFNANSSFIGDERHLSKDEIKEYILNKGHEIAVHGAEHKSPGAVTLVDGIQDMLNGRRELEQMFGGIIKGMAYPNAGITIFDNGATYSEIRNYLIGLGICYSRSLGGDNCNFRIPEDWYNWIPTAHHDNPHLFEWIEKFIDFDINSTYLTSRRPMLLYIWGHSKEFEEKHNWNRLTEICERISHKNDVWYATNMDIYNYVTAYRALEFNVDRTVCYNPTLYTIWFTANGNNYCIKSGETLVT